MNRPRLRDSRSAQSDVVCFLLRLPLFVAAPLFVRLRWGGPRHPAIDFACMAALCWCPAAAAFSMRGRHASDPSLGFAPGRHLRSYATAVIAPIAVVALSYAICWRLKLAAFQAPGAGEGPGAWGLAAFTLGQLGSGLWLWAFLALGEEIGWRGFLLPRLFASGWRWPVLASGVIWSLWHVPSVLWGSYPAGPNRPLSAVVLTITLTAFAWVLARLRIEGGSLWPPVLSHATWNSTLFDSFDHHVPRATMWTRESGLMMALVTVVVAAVLTAGRWSRPARSRV